MIFKLGESIIDIDVEKTREFYRTANIITDGCTCDGCRNYVKATQYFPKNVQELFDEWGIDLNKAAEIWAICGFDNGKVLLYGGFYHVCGKLLTDTDVWCAKQNDKINTLKKREKSLMYEIEKNYSIGFTEDCDLLEENFPAPVIQLEIDFCVPWVLKEKNNY